MTENNVEPELRSTIAVLGLGPMGRALAAAALTGGHPTVVWNRTPEKAQAFVAQGAVLAPTAADAVRGASIAVVCMINYGAVRASVADIADWPTGTLVNLSSGHAGEARAMAGWAAQRGISYLDGAILTPAPTVGTRAATILYSGPRSLFDRSRALLEAFGTSVYLGDDIGIGSAYEMALLDLFAMSVGGLAHAFALAIAEGIEPAAFARFAKGIGGLLPDMADRFADQLAVGRFPAEVSSIASAGSAVAHVSAAAAARGIDTTTLQAVQRIIGRAAAAGYGGDSYARLAQFLAEADHADASAELATPKPSLPQLSH
ncbi:NAD(P)-dependent oxidoreductase [Dactylosporangium salmoneum]|uniref:NAD(P)-binding domain-containing protein n=1 Tax=Dactylosporangium salmoneum TaxID=53361 RepID=A0ABP5UHD8_9ACTN